MRTAWPVPSCSFWKAKAIRLSWSPTAARTSSAWLPITTTVRATPAPLVASTTWLTIGRPAIGWRSLLQRDCIRLPIPAARMSASVSRRAWAAPRSGSPSPSCGTGPTGLSGYGLSGMAACGDGGAAAGAGGTRTGAALRARGLERAAGRRRGALERDRFRRLAATASGLVRVDQVLERLLVADRFEVRVVHGVEAVLGV